MNKLREGETTLENVTKDFSRLWAESGDLWNDDAKRYFESEFAASALAEASALLEKVRELAETVEQARREVE